MSRKTGYNIAFGGLKLGTHHFDYKIDDKFFSNFEHLNILQGDVDVSILLEKQDSMINLHFAINGSIVRECDRCLEPFNLHIEGENKLIIKFGHKYSELDDEIIIVPETTHTIDVAKYICEFIQLAIPMQSIHPDNEDGESECNAEMLERMEIVQPEKEVDSRWDALKSLKE